MAEPENPLKVLEILQRIFASLDRRSLAQCAQVLNSKEKIDREREERERR